MTTQQAVGPPVAQPAPTTSLPTLRERVEDFFSYEAELLDERQYRHWLDLLAEDVRYFMPLTRNVQHDKLATEYTLEDSGVAWFDEDKKTLSQRVEQILLAGDHWAEEPLSRTMHMISNVRVERASTSEVHVRSKFLVYVNRREDEIRLFAGKRFDLLRPEGDGFLVARRKMLLDQSTLQAKNLTTFF